MAIQLTDEERTVLRGIVAEKIKESHRLAIDEIYRVEYNVAQKRYEHDLKAAKDKSRKAHEALGV